MSYYIAYCDQDVETCSTKEGAEKAITDAIRAGHVTDVDNMLVIKGEPVKVSYSAKIEE